MRWPERRWAPLVLLALGLVVFGAVSGSRLTHQSSDPHFVYQADAWLHGQVAIEPPPAKGDDWAKVETVELDDGSTVRGRRLTSKKKKGVFRTTAGDEVQVKRIRRSVATTHFVSFPPFPSVLMLPQVMVHGRGANDVVPTVLIAALILPLAFLTLGRLRAAGLSARTPSEDVWLVVCLAFGTVLFFSSVQGRVWFTAHVVGVNLALGYLLFAIDARRPFWAGVLLGLAAGTRTPMLFMAPLFLLEAHRVSATRRELASRVLTAALPALAIGLALAWYNLIRFGEATEFGHRYLAVRQQAQIEEWGMFSVHYLWRNLKVAFGLLPEILGHPPWVRISGHGLAIWITSPVFLLLLRPRACSRLIVHLWITVACVAVWSLVYQNTGWVQFGYRFLLDYVVLLVVILALGGRPIGPWTRTLILLGILVNLFGAITFNRAWQFYRTDAKTYEMATLFDAR